MILIKEKTIIKSGINKTSKIYINTLVPNFEFRNKQGNIIKQQKYCINL
jgi:hypothetical protein